MTLNTRKLLLALALTTAPMGALADTATTETEITTTETTTDTATTDTEVTNDAVTTASESDGVQGNERQGGFPWGLLGLLGLAGLAGRNRAPEPRTEVRLGGPTDGPRQS